MHVLFLGHCISMIQADSHAVKVFYCSQVSHVLDYDIILG
jgi:hypothetical protein